MHIAARGYIQRRQGNLEEALGHIEKASVLDSRNIEIRFDGLASTYRVLRRYTDAIREFDRTLAIQPGFYDAKVQKGWAYFDRDGQLDTLRAALYGNTSKEDNFEIPAWNRYNLEAFSDRYDDALRIARAAPDVMTKQSLYLVRPLLVGHAEKLRGNSAAARIAYDSARVMLEKALREQPGAPRVVASLGHAYAGLGRMADARRLARHLERLPRWRGAGGTVCYRRRHLPGAAGHPLPASSGRNQAVVDRQLRGLGRRRAGRRRSHLHQ